MWCFRPPSFFFFVLLLLLLRAFGVWKRFVWSGAVATCGSKSDTKAHNAAEVASSELSSLLSFVFAKKGRDLCSLPGWASHWITPSFKHDWKEQVEEKRQIYTTRFLFFFCLFRICNIIYNIILTEQTELYNTKIPKDRLTPKENSDLVFPS